MRLCLRMPGKGPRVHLPKPTQSQRFCFSRSGWRPETGKLVVLCILANLTLCNRLSPIFHQLFNSRGRFNCNHMGSFIFISENWIHLPSAFLLPADELCNFLNLTPCESNRTGHLWSYSRKFKTSPQLLHHLTLIPVEGFSSAFYKMNTTLSQFSCLKQNLLSDLQVVYFGDSMHSDIFPACHYSNWETVLILEELRGDRDGKPEDSEPLEKKGKYEVRVSFGSFLERKALCFTYLRKCLFVPREMKSVGTYCDLHAISALQLILWIVLKWCQDKCCWPLT